MNKIKKLVAFLVLPMVLIYVLLLIPDAKNKTIYRSNENPFLWNRDLTWQQLEARFQEAKQLDQLVLDSTIQNLSLNAEQQLLQLKDKTVAADDTLWNSIESSFFSLAPLVAAQQKEKDWFIGYYNRTRTIVKAQSEAWDMNSKEARATLYKLLYGMRAAVEEVLLVSNQKNFNPAMLVKNELSATPSTQILGIPVHSGDLLVSRGGAEVSALISRGNDYPGNFSHVAFIYIDSASNTPYLIEAHIEKGVALATVDQYLADKKLRFMVLRPRADLPQLIKDPMLPHKAARLAYQDALTRHIPYDFKMNFHDSVAMFCSEVGSYAYRKNGIQLWQAVSTISSQGIVNWLHSFGVENFVTQMPSDLEYDPQLAVVGEWRDPETLLKDHIDNAVMDAMLTRADKGDEVGYNMWLLAFARILKGYCMLLNLFGEEGIIPEGMSATIALRNTTFVEMHKSLKERTEKAVQNFIVENGYTPPYWQLLKLAEQEQIVSLMRYKQEQ